MRYNPRGLLPRALYPPLSLSAWNIDKNQIVMGIAILLDAEILKRKLGFSKVPMTTKQVVEFSNTIANKLSGSSSLRNQAFHSGSCKSGSIAFDQNRWIRSYRCPYQCDYVATLIRIKLAAMPEIVAAQSSRLFLRCDLCAILCIILSDPKPVLRKTRDGKI